MLLLLQIILCCLLYLALVKCAVRDSGRNCLYFYPDAYLDEAQKRGIADKTEELRKGKRFMTFFCLVIFAVLVAIIAGWNGVKDFHTACFEAYLFLVVMNWFSTASSSTCRGLATARSGVSRAWRAFPT